jgi:hypothetical protein
MEAAAAPGKTSGPILPGIFISLQISRLSTADRPCAVRWHTRCTIPPEENGGLTATAGMIPHKEIQA